MSRFSGEQRSPGRVAVVLQGQSGLTGSAQTGRSFPKRSFVRPSWMEEDTVDSAGASQPVFFSKVSGLLPNPGRASKTLLLPPDLSAGLPAYPSFSLFPIFGFEDFLPEHTIIPSCDGWRGQPRAWLHRHV